VRAPIRHTDAFSSVAWSTRQTRGYSSTSFGNNLATPLAMSAQPVTTINRFRLIGRVFYAAGKLYILGVMDHKEYDKGRWIDDCGCYDPPPKSQPETKKSPASSVRMPRRRKRGS